MSLPAPPERLSLADLLTDHSVLLATEQADKARLDAIGTQAIESLRPRFVEWVLKGRPSPFPLISLEIHPPPRCSDGECRCLPDYIQFCSGKTIMEHVALLQAKLPDIRVSFANIQGVVTILIVTA